MAEIRLSNMADEESKAIVDFLVKEYSELADFIEKEAGYDMVFNLVVDQKSDIGFSVTLTGKNAETKRWDVTIGRSFRLGQDMSHDVFELPAAMQGRGIAKRVMQSSLAVVDQFDLKRIDLEANLDVGGYAWLRRGAFPNDRDLFLGIFDDYARTGDPSTLSRKSVLANELKNIYDKLNDDELRVFVLSPEFQKFKDLFLGVEWEGEFDVTNGVVRTAMVDGADAAYKVATGRKAPKVGATLNEQISDAYTRRQVYLLQYAQGLSNRAYANLDATTRAVVHEIQDKLEKLVGTRLLTRESQLLMTELEDAITQIRLAGWDKANEIIESELQALAGVEASAAVTTIQGIIPAVLNLKLPDSKHLNRITQTQPFEGRLLAEWLRRTENADIDKIVNAVKIGIVQGQTLDDIVRRVRGTATEAGVASHSRQQVEALVRTVVNGVQNEAKQMLYAENADVIGEEYFVATLDIRTTIVCADNDGKIFKRGQGPMPPLHFGCRSLRAPYINPEFWSTRGFDPSVESEFLKDFIEENKLSKVSSPKDLPYGFKTNYTKYVRQRRRDLVGTLPAKVTFNEWLRNQSDIFQNEYLGINRAEAFRAGNFKLDRFLNSDGKLLTLEELSKAGVI